MATHPPPSRRILRGHVFPTRNTLRELDDDPAPRWVGAPPAPAAGHSPGSGAPGPTLAGRAAERLVRWLDASTAGRSWIVRAPLVPVLGWIAWKHAGDIWWGSIFQGINLAFHEIGHVVFGFFGVELLTIAGGTILELLVPVVAAVALARQRDAFGVAVCVFWLGTALAGVGRYVYDTRSQIGNRVSLGPLAGPDDWTYLLSRWDLVRQDRVIGMAVKETGVAVMVAGIVFASLVLWRMARSTVDPGKPRPERGWRGGS